MNARNEIQPMEINHHQIRAILKSPLRAELIREVGSAFDLSGAPERLPDEVLTAIASCAEEVLLNEAPEVESFNAEQSKSAYSVTTYGVEGAYFVRAIEFDDLGVFSTLEEARAEADSMHGEFRLADCGGCDDAEADEVEAAEAKSGEQCDAAPERDGPPPDDRPS
jgi:hypothetical protein